MINTEPVSLEAATEKFISALRIQRRSSATVTAYAGDLGQLKTYLNERRITQATSVQTLHLQDYLNQILQNGYTPKSASRKLNSIKSYFKFLQSSNLITEDPSAAISHPKYDTSAPRILTTAEYKSLQDACRLDIRTAAIVELLLQTGIRISELAAIELEDIKKAEVYIRPIENNPARTIPLGKSAQSAVQNYLSVRPKDATVGNLFITKTGRPLLIRNVRTIIDRYFREAGVKGAKVNDLRHTFIAHQLEEGVGLDYVSQVVGHKRQTSTQKYLEFVKIPSSPPISRLQEL